MTGTFTIPLRMFGMRVTQLYILLFAFPSQCRLWEGGVWAAVPCFSLSVGGVWLQNLSLFIPALGGYRVCSPPPSL